MSAPQSERILYDGKFLSMVQRGHWEFASRCGCTGAVVVVPQLASGELMLIRQYRLPLQRFVIEFPAGLVGDDGDGDESILQAAERELLEEAGCAADGFRILGQVATSPGLSDEVITYLAGDNCRQIAAGGGLANETIEVVRIPASEVDAWLLQREQAGDLISGTIYCGLQLRQSRTHHPHLAANYPGAS